MWIEVDYIICSCFLSKRGAICSGEELISVEMSTAAHKVANNVIKFLRWRNSDESGMVAAGFIGVAFDVAEPLSTPVEYCEWIPAERGQAGYWLPHRSQWFFREWVNEWSPEHRELLRGGIITAAGCRPIVGTVDPLPGMLGPVWDIYVTVTPALAGGSARTVYVHPSSDGKLTRIATGTDAQRAERLRAVRHRGVRAKLLALYPGMPPRVHPRGPQEQIGWEQVPELLLGGRQTTLAQAGAAPGFGFPTASPQAALADCAAVAHSPQAGVASSPGAYVAQSALASHPAALAASSTDPGPGSAAAVVQAEQMRRHEYLVVLDPNRNEASWCGWHLTLHNNAIWTHWHGQWWRLRGPDPVFHPYSKEHWWESNYDEQP